MWYQAWQSGYDDILKRGVPRPGDPRTVLADLHSPVVPSFLHGSTAQVPFLVTSATRKYLEQTGLTGFEFADVVVTRIATTSRSRRASRGGEPEDVILKFSGGDLADAPTLHAVHVTGGVEVRPDIPGGRHSSGAVSPFDLPSEFTPCDLWRPLLDGRAYSGWVFCSERFRSTCVDQGFTNVSFEPFDEFMGRFRREVAAR